MSRASTSNALPFGDGGSDVDVPRAKIYTHGPCASPLAAKFVVSARQSDPSTFTQDEATRRNIVTQALNVLREHGFVILEGMYKREAVQVLEAAAIRHLDAPSREFISQPLRAGRNEVHVPYADPWSCEWLMKHELVLDIVAGYVCNDMAGGRTEEEQQWRWVEWVTLGAELDWFRDPANGGPVLGHLLDAPPVGCANVGTTGERGPWFGRASLTRTPPGAAPQKRHRDIILPGPAAQLTIQVALTPLVANNGPLGYFPGSHVMRTPGYEVVANPPLGSVVMYDSFTEHRGLENHTAAARYALYYEFETRGLFSGYTDSHFGPETALHTTAFRRLVDPELRRRVRQLQLTGSAPHVMTYQRAN